MAGNGHGEAADMEIQQCGGRCKAINAQSVVFAGDSSRDEDNPCRCSKRRGVSNGAHLNHNRVRYAVWNADKAATVGMAQYGDGERQTLCNLGKMSSFETCRSARWLGLGRYGCMFRIGGC